MGVCLHSGGVVADFAADEHGEAVEGHLRRT